MPKNLKNPNNPYPPIVSDPKRPLDPNLTGSGGPDWAPPEPILLLLTNVKEAAISLKPGDPVLLLIDSLPIWVTTPLGEPIGQVHLDDVEAVRQRKLRRGSVVFVEKSPLACAVEVR